MDLKRLKYFCTAFEQRSIVGAAKILNMAHQPLSKRLQELEDEVGTPLLTRSGKGLVPTEAGIYLYRRACEILRNVEETKKETIRFAKSDKKIIRIGLSYLFRLYFTPFLIELCKRHPDIHINISVSDSSHLEFLLNHNHIDVALVQEPWSKENYDKTKFDQIPVVLVVSNKLLTTEIINNPTIEKLAKLPLIILRRIEGPGTCEIILDQLLKSGIEANVVMHVSQPNLVIDMLENGVSAATLLPSSEVNRRSLRNCSVINISPTPLFFSPCLIKLASVAPIEEITDLLRECPPSLRA